MREITRHIENGDDKGVTVHAVDERGPGGACSHYLVGIPGQHNVELRFSGQNSRVTDEALLAVLIDRMNAFNDGPVPSNETEWTMMQLTMALSSLRKRTHVRTARGIEGTMQV